MVSSIKGDEHELLWVLDLGVEQYFLSQKEYEEIVVLLRLENQFLF